MIKTVKRTPIDNELLTNAQFGNINGVMSAISNGANINIQNSMGDTALILAAEKGYTEIVKFLLTKKPDLNIKGSVGMTALMSAIYQDWDEIVEILLKEKNIDVNICNMSNMSPLMLAISHNKFKIAQSILKKNPNLYLKDDDENTVFDIAKSNKNIEFIKLLSQQKTK